VQNDTDPPGYYSPAFTAETLDAAGEPWSRAFTADVETDPLPWSLAITELEIRHSGVRDVRSSGGCWAYAVSGTPAEQMSVLNAGPPPFDPNTWVPVYRWHDFHVPRSFTCGSVPDPLAEPYVGALWFVNFSDQVTYDNCGSAFYRFTFTLPNGFEDAAMQLAVNADQIAVAFLNGQRISAAMALTDLGLDRVDGQNLPVLTWPTLDWWTLQQTDLQMPGENELVFAVMGDASAFKPTGIELRATAWFDVRGDLNCDEIVDFGDINPFIAILSGG
jgi:hypothetical protein